MRILREGVPDGIIVNPGATETLQQDDRVDIVSGLPLRYIQTLPHTAPSTLHHSYQCNQLITAPQRTVAENLLLRNARKSQNTYSNRRLRFPWCVAQRSVAFLPPPFSHHLP
jgi:hypothetical protein